MRVTRFHQVLHDTPNAGVHPEFWKDHKPFGGLLPAWRCLDWVGSQRDSIREGKAKMDECLRDKFREVADKSNLDAVWLDRRFPRVPFEAKQPANFVYRNLVRTLIEDAGRFKKNDAIDFCHAVVASSYASVAALDKRWKRLIESLPSPNGLARIYAGEPELDNLVADMESCAARGVPGWRVGDP